MIKEYVVTVMIYGRGPEVYRVVANNKTTAMARAAVMAYQTKSFILTDLKAVEVY